MGEPGCIAGVDVGASRVRVALFRGRRMVAREERPFPARGGAEAPSRLIRDVIAGLLAKTGCGGGLEAVGVASIGPIDPVRGIVENTPNAPIKSFPLKEPLERSLGVPVIVANDCNAGAWAEYVLGRGGGFRSMAYVAVGTGIWGGIVLGGRLLQGPRGFAGEVGHLVVDLLSEARCGCGGWGHWEALASGSAISRTTWRLAKSWRGPVTTAYRMALEGVMGAEELYQHAREGDPFALEVVGYLARVHAAGIASIVVAYDVEAVFLGGGALLGGWDLLEGRIRGFLKDYLGYSINVAIERCSFGVDQQLYGALALVLRRPEAI